MDCVSGTSESKRIMTTLGKIWRSRDQLSLKNIRRSHLPYSMVLPFLLALLNMQNHYLSVPETLFGLDSLTLMYCSCCIGILGVLIISFRYWESIVRVLASSSLFFIAIRVILPSGLNLPALMLCWLGVGGCIAYAICSFVFVLNNTERMTGILLSALSHGAYMCLLGFEVGGVFFTHLLPIILTFASAVCIFLAKSDKLAEANETKERTRHPATRLSFPFFLTAFIIDSISSFVFTQEGFSLSFINGLGVFAAAALVLTIQLFFKKSIWHMWNMFYALAFISHLLVLSDDPTVRTAAYFLHGMIYIGYVSVHYTIGGIHKKFSSLRGLRNGMILLFSILVPSLALLGFAESLWPHAFAIATAAACCISMVAFLMLSPSFQRYFFNDDRIDEYRSADMRVFVRRLQELNEVDASEARSIKNVGLSEDEIKVAMLLIEGNSRTDILRKLHISADEVGQHEMAIRQKIMALGDTDPGITNIVAEYKLTKRETDMLRFLRNGMTNAGMAEELFLSEETVKIHVRSLMKKLPVNSRTEVPSWLEALSANYPLH